MIIAYIVGVLLGGWLALWFIWQIITMLVRFIYYLTHRKQIKKEKVLAKKEKELNEWQREQWIKEGEERRRRAQEKEAKERRQKEKDREEAIENGRYGWFEEKYGETVEGEKIYSED